MVKYKELDNLQRSVVDIGVLLKSVIKLALEGISNPKISFNLAKVVFHKI